MDTNNSQEGEERGDHSYSLLHFPAANEHYNIKPCNLHLKFLTRISNHRTCNYQTVPRLDLSTEC